MDSTFPDVWCYVEKPTMWWKVNILSVYHLNDFNLLFLKLIKFCLYDTYIQSYTLSK